MNKLYIVYKFTNTVTGDFYIGSRNKIKETSSNRKYQSVWIAVPDKLYLDVEKYGTDKFEFEILAEVEEEELKEADEIIESGDAEVEANKLKEMEQQFIETLKSTYNQMNAKDLDVVRNKQ